LIRAVGSSNAQALEIVKFLVEKGATISAFQKAEIKIYGRPSKAINDYILELNPE
jgi:hypothetical protein